MNNILDLPKLTTLSIGSNSFGNSSIFHLSNLNSFQSLNIGNEMYQSLNIGNEMYNGISTFLIEGLSSLTSLSIGSNSFTSMKNGFGNDINKSFHILNCTKLESIEIGEYSFSDFAGEFELSNLPQLQSIQIGQLNSDSYNFYSMPLNIQGIELIY